MHGSTRLQLLLQVTNIKTLENYFYIKINYVGSDMANNPQLQSSYLDGGHFDGTGRRKKALQGMVGDHDENPWKFRNHVIV